MKTFLIFIAIYIVQVFVLLAYPYYVYRRDCKEERTIGGFINYMNSHDMSHYMFCAFFPYIGIAIVVIVIISLTIMSSFIWIYRNFIKNIKI